MTAPPLYLGHEKPDKCDKEGNQGLWFERFFDQYNDQQQWANPKPDTKANSTWLQGFKKAGNDKQLATHTQAQMQLVSSLQGETHVFKASWHFVTGMGNPHPVENGFAWHPTLGVPYLTGAAVKGLVRTFIETQLDETDSENPDKKELLLQWFGSTNKNPTSKDYKAQAGELIFFDALPIEPVTLGVDIMTPHMGKWYEKGGTDKAAGTAEAVPADWHDPNPIAFLVAKDITLLFSFAMRPHPPAKDKPFRQLDITEVEQALTAVLEQMGAGGKTATGYGSFNIDVKATQKAALAILSGQDLYRSELKMIDDKKLAEMLGKNFNKTKDDKGDNWDDWLDVVFDEKRSLINSWAIADKNSSFEKAYKNLKNKTERLN